MDNGDQTAIRKMIVHTVNHKSYPAPVYSDLESPVTDEAGRFLRQHIISNRDHRRARTAQFIRETGDANPMSALCDAILAEPSTFVERSKEIADRLFRAMGSDGRISPGELVVCTFAEGPGKGSEWLALLKMDPQDGFVGVREQSVGGTRVVLRRVADVLPSGELQKCAFILPPELRETRGHDLIVLDQQVARFWARRLVASFFLRDFLQCEVGFEKQELTRAFMYQAQAWASRKEHIWPAGDLMRFHERATATVQEEIVDLAAFAQAVIRDPTEQDEFLVYMKREGIDLTFEPDAGEQKRWTEHAWYRGDDDLQVRILAAAVGEGKTLHWEFDEPTNTYIVTIRTANWEPFLKRGP